MKRLIYLDYNASTPVHPEVASEMRPYLDEYFGNPSSDNAYGASGKKAVEKAREQVASLIGCKPHEIIFTSGGTESNNLAIKGVAFANRGKGKHIITSTIEHPAVTEVCHYLEKEGFEITWTEVDEHGIVDPASIEDAIRDDTVLVSIMHANNETGSIQPLKAIASICKAKGVLFHTDAAQSAGKIDIRNTGADLISLAGHKFYAPKGIGALYIREGVRLEKIMHGADHERNLRAGTENVLEIAGIGKAAEIAVRDLPETEKHLRLLRDLLEKLITEAIPGTRVNGHHEKRLPNTLSISFKGLDANVLLSEIKETVAASAGAACHTGEVTGSPVLNAMKVPGEYLSGTVRFSVGRFLSVKDIESAADTIIAAVKRLEPGNTINPGTGPVKLTSFTHGLGCACKLRPQVLEEVIKKIPFVQDPNILVGFDSSDDAAVYRINDTESLVMTVDFFTPVVDDPYDFGAIAAANALSDVYAMGAKPLFALNIVGFPTGRLPVSVLENILLGASEKAKEAGIQVIGGHSIDDVEPKFGMVVAGIIKNDSIITNSRAKDGDVLMLTKPVGTGILSTAMKKGLLEEEEEGFLLEWMKMLNNKAAEAMLRFNVSSCTDISGFGLLGHLKEMVKGSLVEATVFADRVPVLKGAEKLAGAGVIPGGTRNNLEFVDDIVEWAEDISEIKKLLLCDAQTSGGLLISVPGNYEQALTDALRSQKIEAFTIGTIEKGEPKIRVAYLPK